MKEILDIRPGTAPMSTFSLHQITFHSRARRGNTFTTSRCKIAVGSWVSPMSATATCGQVSTMISKAVKKSIRKFLHGSMTHDVPKHYTCSPFLVLHLANKPLALDFHFFTPKETVLCGTSTGYYADYVKCDLVASRKRLFACHCRFLLLQPAQCQKNRRRRGKSGWINTTASQRNKA